MATQKKVISKAATGGVLLKKVFLNFRKFHRKTPLLEFVLKRKFQHRCFPVNFAKFSRTFVLKNVF